MKSGLKTMVAVGMLSAGLALAEDKRAVAPPKTPPPGPGAVGQGAAGPFRPGFRGPSEEQARMARLGMVLRISEELGLTEQESLRLSESLKAFEGRRQPLHERMRKAMETLRDAAEDPKATQPQVDAATEELFQLREQLANLDKQVFLTVAKDFAPHKRAKLALVMAKTHREQMFRGAMRGRKGPPGGFGPGHMGPPQHDD